MRSGIRPALIRWALVMIRLSAACRNTSVSRTTGTMPEPMMSASTCPGPTEGSWSTSPTRITAEPFRTALRVAARIGTSTMLVSSRTSRVQSSGFSSVRLKPPPAGSNSSNRWIVLASSLGHPLGRPPGGGGQQDLDPLGRQDLQDGVDQRGFTHPRPAGDDHDLGRQGHPDRRLLALRQRDAQLGLDPRDSLVGLNARPGRLPVPQGPEPLGDAPL